MSTLAEVENAVAALPHNEQEVLLRHLSAKLKSSAFCAWPVPPPNVPPEEIRRIQAEIDAVFSRPENAE